MTIWGWVAQWQSKEISLNNNRLKNIYFKTSKEAKKGESNRYNSILLILIIKKSTIKDIMDKRERKLIKQIVYKEHYYYDKKGELLIEKVSFIPKNWYKKNKFD